MTKTVRERIVDVLRDHPEGLSESSLAKLVDANRGVVHKAAGALEADGKITIQMQGELGRGTLARIHQLKK
jgi:hypothetical protein